MLTFNYKAPLGIFGLTSIGAVLVSIAFHFLLFTDTVPHTLLPTLQMLVAPCVILSRAPQIYQNFKTKSTGQLSLITWFANFGGGLARVFTTFREVQDPLVLGTFILATFLNGIIVAQIFIYWSNTNKLQANKLQANKGQANKGQANKGQANKGQSNKGQANKGQSNKGQANKAQYNKGQANNKGKTTTTTTTVIRTRTNK